MRFVLEESHAAAWANYSAAERALCEGRVQLDSRPVHARVEVTTRCNLRCVQCKPIQEGRPGRDMAIEVLERIASEVLPTAAAVQYADEGEPLLYVLRERMLELLAEHRHPYSRIFTNATILDEALSRRLIECGLRDLAVSLDGATKTTFEGIRRGASFDHIVENLARLRDLKREMGSELPVVTIHAVIMRGNLGELSSIVRLAKDLAAEEVIFYALNCYTREMHARSTASLPEETRRSLTEAVEVGVELGLPVRWSPDLPTPPVPRRERIDDRFYLGTLSFRSSASLLLFGVPLARPSVFARPFGWLINGQPVRFPPGSHASFAVEVHNRSPFTWYSSLSPSTDSNMNASYHVYATDGSLLSWDGERTPLPRHLKPGERGAIDVRVALPERCGEFALGFDLVNEGGRWFGLDRRMRITVSEAAVNAAVRNDVPIEATPTSMERCEHPWKYVVLKVNGDVFPCRFLELSMGNLREHSFTQIWNSQSYLSLRQSILDGSYSICRGALCPFACAPAGMFRSRIELLVAPERLPPGGIGKCRVAVTNLGTQMWKAQPTSGDPTYFVLRSRVSNQDGSERPAKPMMQTLPHDIAPGACVELDMEIQAPQRPGRYVVAVDVSRRYVFAFTTLGNPVCEVPLRVG